MNKTFYNVRYRLLKVQSGIDNPETNDFSDMQWKYQFIFIPRPITFISTKFLHFALFLMQEGLNLAIYEVKMEK